MVGTPRCGVRLCRYRQYSFADGAARRPYQLGERKYCQVRGGSLRSFPAGGFGRGPAPGIMDVSGTIEAILAQKGTEIFSISPDATVFEAVELMANKNVGALLVIQDDRLVGLISERDYTRKVMLRGKRSRETQVREIMSSDLTVVSPREPVENCLRMMTDKRVRHLPVLDGNAIRGIISIGDLVKWVIATQSAAIQHLEMYISGGYTG